VSDVVLDALVFLHVLSAMGWLGGGLFTAFAIAPSLRKISSTASLEFNAKVLPRIIMFVRAASGATVLFGLLLLGYVYSQDSTYFSSAAGESVSLGIALAVVAFVVAFGMTIPAFVKVSRLSETAGAPVS